jgi:hypothetical protein
MKTVKNKKVRKVRAIEEKEDGYKSSPKYVNKKKHSKFPEIQFMINYAKW